MGNSVNRWFGAGGALAGMTLAALFAGRGGSGGGSRAQRRDPGFIERYRVKRNHKNRIAAMSRRRNRR